MNLKVNITNVHGSQMAAKITGNFTIDEHSFRFTAIAFGRIGGQNIGAKISKNDEKWSKMALRAIFDHFSTFLAICCRHVQVGREHGR